MATAVTLLDANVDATGSNNPYSTASVTPSADSTILLCVTTRAASSAVRPPTISGLGLTWTSVVEIQHDTGGTLSYMQVFRAETGSSPSTGTVTITCPSDPVGIHWHLLEVTETDLTTDNGVVQYATNLDAGGTVGTITSTFGSSPASDAVIVSYCSIQEGTTTTFTEDSGFTELSKVGPSESEQSATQYQVGGSPGTTATGAWVTEVGPIGIISIEVKVADTGISGTLAVTLDAFTSAASGVLEYSGTLAVTLADAASAASGTVAGLTTGVVDVTLDAFTSAASGESGIHGAVAVTLDAFATSMTPPHSLDAGFDVVRFYRRGSAQFVLVVGLGRSAGVGYRSREGWYPCSGTFAVPVTFEARAMSDVRAVWAANKAESTATLTAAVNAALNAAGYRRPNGDNVT